MVTRLTLASTLALLLAGSAVAQTQVIVQDNFDQYDNAAEFLAEWPATIGLGTAPALSSDELAGVPTSDPVFGVPDNFPGVEGVAIDHVGASATNPGQVNQWGGVIDHLGQNPAFQIAPSATQSVYLEFDLFMGNSGNERMTVGLRHTTALPDDTNKTGNPPVGDADTYPDANTANILELGAYNGVPNTPIVPGAETQSANFAFRIINFGPVSAPLTAQPNWQYFKLPEELDRETDLDEIVNVGDIGAAWHTYAATITPTEITLTLDLYRDGKRNTSTTADENGDRPGVDGEFDALLVLPVSTNALGFNNLRMGGPSGSSSAGTGAMGFDNVLLQLQAAAVTQEDADFDGDGDVDGRDFLTWQRNLGAIDENATLANGNADGDQDIDQDDLAIWKQQFSAGGAPVAAIPEPTTVALGALAILAGLAVGRRK